MLPHHVHFRDGGARFQQRLVHGLLVLERHAFGGKCQQRRAAAGNQAEHEVVLGQPLHHIEDASRRLAAGFVGDGMGGLDHFEALRRHAIAVTGDDEPFERPVPSVLEGLGHRAGGFARADNDSAAFGFRRQMRRHAERRQGCVHTGLEHGFEKRFGRHFFSSTSPSKLAR